MLNRNRQRGFTLIELLIVVAIIGIIAAILIPNLLDALQKAKQKRTVADMRNTGTAWMSWLTDQIGAASAGQGKFYDASSYNEVAYGTLFNYLNVPDSNTFFYMQEVPQLDGWQGSYAYSQNSNLVSTAVIAIASGGRGNVFDDGPRANWAVGPFVATDYNQDIVWADGYFVRWPE